MNEPDGVLIPWLRRLGGRFGRDSDADTGSSNESGWKRYGKLLQVLVTIGILFGGALGNVSSAALHRTTDLTHTVGVSLSGFLWPTLVGVTAIAVTVCAVVVALGIRNA